MSERLAGVYIHVPFCARVCPYCDFAVRTGDSRRRARYVEHLAREIELYGDLALTFDTIYLGGGTPSALDPEQIARIVDKVERTLAVPEGPWRSIEANPEDVTAETVAAWRRIGIHTVSLGVQSFDGRALQLLGRRHDPAAARRAVELTLAAGFPTVSLDLIYGLPGQTAEDWRRELDQALALAPQHVSCYQLTIHRQTRFGLLERRGELRQLPDDDQAELFRLTHRHLNAAGLQGYEVSNFAAGPEHRSRHNSKYWDHTPYLGLGPSAHSFDDGRRWWNLRRTDPWEQRIASGERPVDEAETLEIADLALESLMLGLRTYAGVDLRAFRERFGIDLLARNARTIERLQAEGRLTLARDRLTPTLDGLVIADALASSFELRH